MHSMVRRDREKEKTKEKKLKALERCTLVENDSLEFIP